MKILPTLKLTRKFFFGLQPQVFLASNCFDDSSRKPIFSEKVESNPKAREDQWKRIVSSGASQRVCHVFDNEESLRTFLKNVGRLAQSS